MCCHAPPKSSKKYKKVNLGLDLQGGSYLLLEINSDNLVKEKIQSKVIPIKKLLKDNQINYNNFKINENNLNDVEYDNVNSKEAS